MRLLHTTTLKLHEFFDDQIPEYAILSHRWGAEEVTYDEYIAGQGHAEPAYRMKAGYKKIIDLCRVALGGIVVPPASNLWRTTPEREWLAPRYTYDFVWIDTICIDKRSSAELSEAINSMFKWYERACVCLVFLLDVESVQECHADINETVITKFGHSSFIREQFVNITWFTRGWTLQELLAPEVVVFYDARIRTIGCKISTTRSHYLDKVAVEKTLNLEVIEAAGVGDLTPPGPKPVAQLISWISHRQTSRAEDMAYCLLGLCGVNMPLLYGEGGKRAF